MTQKSSILTLPRVHARDTIFEKERRVARRKKGGEKKEGWREERRVARRTFSNIVL
jgi:hypothetical protein